MINVFVFLGFLAMFACFHLSPSFCFEVINDIGNGISFLVDLKKITN